MFESFFETRYVLTFAPSPSLHQCLVDLKEHSQIEDEEREGRGKTTNEKENKRNFGERNDRREKMQVVDNATNELM